MILKFLLLVFVFAGMMPAYGQFANPTLQLQTVEVPPHDFNRVRSDVQITNFDAEHATNWQVTIKNKLIYANPEGNAVVRIYDAGDSEKFVEVGMGSIPDRKFWVAFNLPEMGYIHATTIDKNGWSSDAQVTIGYGAANGVSISNGQRVVVSNFEIENFVVGGYGVYGMNERGDPPAINSGTFTVEVISGDTSRNPFHHYPFYVSVAVGAIIVALLVFKKRS
jgi:hypothetical protein